MKSDTIAAIATPIGTAGIGVVRVSGPEALGVASRIFASGNAAVSDFPSHTAHHGALLDPITGAEIDQVVLTVFHAPSSYTGEDVIEVSCHGGIAILRSALAAALASGARPAEPGEFTRRAFMNGKIDLAQAEAVNDLIRARTDDARKVALSQLDGMLSGRVRAVNERILGVIAPIEAAIDFPDDVSEPDPAWIASEIESAHESLGELAFSFGRGRIYREGLRVVIAGEVNVGKSSLLNALLRHARAIVTPIPGTTRDLIEESLEIHGIPVVAIDTAGLRSTNDPIEKIGVELAEKSLESADIVLMVFDATCFGPRSCRCLPQHTIIVLNKIDLIPAEKRAKLLEDCGSDTPVVATCAPSGDGIEELEREITFLATSTDMGSESVMVSNIRHHQLLLDASDSLANALATLGDARPIDLLAVDLMVARNSLGRITGETADGNLLDRIFAEFCIGK